MPSLVGIEEVDVDKLTVAPTNNRIIIPDDKEIHEFITTVDAMGVIEPIIINEKNEIVSGQLRWLIAKKKGLKTIHAVRMHFEDTFQERVMSVVQDVVKVPLEHRDRANFIVECKKLGLTRQEIAKMTGLHPVTISGWEQSAKIPEEIATKPETLKAFQETGSKKKRNIQEILEIPGMKGKAAEIIHTMKDMTLAETENIRKEVKRGAVVDPVARLQVDRSHGTEKYNLRIPGKLFEALILCSKKLNQDTHMLILQFIEQGLKENKLI